MLGNINEDAYGLRFERAARLFSRVRGWGDPFEETSIIPIVVSVSSILLLDHQKLTQDHAMWIAVMIQSVAGIWLGIAHPHRPMFRLLLRAIGVGFTIGIGTILTHDQLGAPANVKILAAAGILSLWVYLGGFILGDGISGVCLTTEAQWQRTKPFVTRIGVVCRWLWRRVWELTIALVVGLVRKYNLELDILHRVGGLLP